LTKDLVAKTIAWADSSFLSRRISHAAYVSAVVVEYVSVVVVDRYARQKRVFVFCREDSAPTDPPRDWQQPKDPLRSACVRAVRFRDGLVAGLCAARGMG
jgi:hypothetical protein